MWHYVPAKPSADLEDNSYSPPAIYASTGRPLVPTPKTKAATQAKR